MITIKQVITGVREYLGRPPHDVLPNYIVLSRLYDKLDLRRVDLNLTGTSWLVERFRLTVDASSDEYSVSAPAGRWILCHTANDADQNHVRREVPILRTIASMDAYYVGPTAISTTSSRPHIATSFAPFIEGGQTKLKVTPRHSQPAEYVFWYAPDRPMPPRLSENFPLVESFVNLLKAETAASLLSEILTPDNAPIVALRRETLQQDVLDYRDAWMRFKTQNTIDQAGSRSGWATDDGYESWM